MRMSTPPPGWYPAPHANNEQRYWDGSSWGESVPPTSPSVDGAAVNAPDHAGLKGSKRWYQRWWIWVIIAVILIGVISQLANGGSEDPAAAPDETSAPSVEPSEAPAEDPEEPAEEASATTPAEAEALWLEMHGVDSPLDFMTKEGYENDLSNPLYAIQTGWTGSTDGYLKINVQEALSDEAVMNLGRGILNFVGPDFPDIDGIAFTDANGLDHNFYRKDAPLAN